MRVLSPRGPETEGRASMSKAREMQANKVCDFIFIHVQLAFSIILQQELRDQATAPGAVPAACTAHRHHCRCSGMLSTLVIPSE